MFPPRPQGVDIDCEATDLVGLLRQRATRQPHQRAFTFLVDGDNERQHVTYEQLDQRARAVAVDLQSRGLAGERALLLYPSGLDFVAAFFGCLYAGVTAVPAYPPRRNRNLARIQSIVADATPKIALTTHSVFDRVEPMIEDLADLRSLPWSCTDDLPSDGADRWRDPKVEESTLAFLQYTSGSTGTPKGVMLSHGNLLHNTAVISDAFKPTHAGVGVTWLPLYHDMGLIGGVIQPIYFGRPNTLLTPTHFLQKPIRWLRTMSDTGAEVSGGPNFAYELCVERITDEEKESLDLSQWT
ncbi:MAG: AMP-binding protein, partial [Planctomycetota bacterium]